MLQKDDSGPGGEFEDYTILALVGVGASLSNSSQSNSQGSLASLAQRYSQDLQSLKEVNCLKQGENVSFHSANWFYHTDSYLCLLKQDDWPARMGLNCFQITCTSLRNKNENLHSKVIFYHVKFNWIRCTRNSLCIELKSARILLFQGKWASLLHFVILAVDDWALFFVVCRYMTSSWQVWKGIEASSRRWCKCEMGGQVILRLIGHAQ